MSPIYQVVYLPEAEVALEKAATYIRDHDGPERAANWLRRMMESIDTLETIPAIFAERGVRGGWKIRGKRMCCNFQKSTRERLVGSTRLRLMRPPRTAC